ncbi:MAG TPA: crotonase/enoyl-CoA hydratase family protein [Acidimicrobiales bacterium]|nr:crotonase/enoyl-CoA hydratase family protein [Acidimicrobiales bacterium]
MSDAPAAEAVTWTVEDGVAVVRIDDGKVNVISHRVLERLHEALDVAAAEARAVAIVGRPGKLSAGFDLTEMTAGPDRTRALVSAGARFLLRLYDHPQPVAVAVTGHALAAGALLVLSCDTRIGADGPAKIGLNETQIGMALPEFAVALAEARLSPTHLTRATIQGEVFDPAGALAAGYLDRVVPAEECEAVTIAEARRLGALRAGAYAYTKSSLRRPMVERLLANLDADMATLTAPDT